MNTINKENIEHFIDAAKNSLISTIDEEGYPATRAMLEVRVREGLNKLYFSTNTSSNKVKEIRKNSKGSVYFFDPQKYIGCLLKGHFDVATDTETKKKIWREGDTLYYPKGIADEDFCVLIFTIDKGRVYSDFTSENFS